MELKNKIIAIVGGMGPASGEFLQNLLFNEMRNNFHIEKDQDYTDVIHFSFGSEIPDRTSFLEGKINLNPAFPVFKIFQQLEKLAKTYKRPIVACIACNTFFAKPILKDFLTLWDREDFEYLQYLNLVEATVNFIKTQFSLGDKIGILTTSGERKLKVYQNLLEDIGVEVLYLDPANQQKLHQAIYKVKSDPFHSMNAHETILKSVQLLLSQGAKRVLLGCTEISLVINQYGFNPSYHIDPLRIVAQVALQETSRILHQKL